MTLNIVVGSNLDIVHKTMEHLGIRVIQQKRKEERIGSQSRYELMDSGLASILEQKLLYFNSQCSCPFCLIVAISL